MNSLQQSPLISSLVLSMMNERCLLTSFIVDTRKDEEKEKEKQEKITMICTYSITEITVKLI
jgi:hypothetical protein